MALTLPLTSSTLTLPLTAGWTQLMMVLVLRVVRADGTARDRAVPMHWLQPH
jgi:hypothetical protein